MTEKRRRAGEGPTLILYYPGGSLKPTVSASIFCKCIPHRVNDSRVLLVSSVFHFQLHLMFFHGTWAWNGQWEKHRDAGVRAQLPSISKIPNCKVTLGSDVVFKMHVFVQSHGSFQNRGSFSILTRPFAHSFLAKKWGYCGMSPLPHSGCWIITRFSVASNFHTHLWFSILFFC